MHIISKGGGIELKFLYSPAFFVVCKGILPQNAKASGEFVHKIPFLPPFLRLRTSVTFQNPSKGGDLE